MSDGFDLDLFLLEFVSECREATELAVQDVLNLEQGGDHESVARIFRALHSIKGNASMFGLMALSEFVHKVEDACSDIRSGQRVVDKQVINVLLRSFDLIEDAFENITAKGSDNIDYSRGYVLLKDLAPDSAISEPVVAEEQPVPAAEHPVEPELPVGKDEPQENFGRKADAEEFSEGKSEDEDLLRLEEEFRRTVGQQKAYSVSVESYVASGRVCPLRVNPTALIVDDDFATRKVFVSFLSRYMPCYVAKDGVEAIQAVTESYVGQSPHFDLIIMDVMMPNIDGLQACKAIRQIERSKNVDSFACESKIFIASTMSDDKTMLKAMYECGADSYLVKPVGFDELRRQLVRFRIIAPE
ncbi:response regulator [Maridesulfovibrio sp. FT414]|uniref:response regulator n=1 Tax=Maridesulfovibrio sp. FT414 TaxID=2979469 RepID=UPI003D8054A0